MVSLSQHSIAVVIPCHNAERWVGRAISSVLEQAERCQLELKVIAIDDGSTDSSLDVIKGFGEHIYWESGANRGACAARNRGLELCTSTYVMFLDADDYIEGDLLAGLSAALGSSDADVALGDWTFESEDGTRCSYPWVFGKGTLDTKELLKTWIVRAVAPPCAVLWRTLAVKKLRGWDISLYRCQDVDIQLRGIFEGYRFVYADVGTGVYFQHEGPGRVSKTPGAKGLGSNLEVFKRIEAQSQGKPFADVIPVLANGFYGLARIAFRGGQTDIGEEALARARSLGVTSHLGSFGHRVLSQAIGLKAKEKVAQAIRGNLRSVRGERTG